MYTAHFVSHLTLMSEDQGFDQEQKDCLVETDVRNIKLVNHQDVKKMLEIQERSLIRFNEVNDKLAKCSSLADEKYSMMARLYKKASKQLADSKKDLDYIHKKISDMKSDLRVHNPEMFKTQPSNSIEE